MSASEKLKALMAGQGGFVVVGTTRTSLHEVGTPHTVEVVLQDALPQMVAVVGNAEEECEQHSASLDGLRAALAALDEKLP